MTTPLRLDYAVNDAEVIAAFKRQQAELEKERKAREGLQKQITDNSNAQKAADKAAFESAKAHAASVREAMQIAEKYATKEERVAAELKRLNELKAKGVLASKDYARAVAAENAKLGESTETASAATGKLTDRFAKMAAVGVGTVAFLQQMSAKLKELGEDMVADVQRFDKLSRKLGIQGGLSEAERKSQSRMVGKVALDAGVTVDKAFETATQLSSSGFQDPVKGGTLNAALALMQSSNQIDGDAAGFIKGSGQFMTAFGMQKNQRNLTDLGIRMQGLFKGTDVQAADLPEFAKAAPVLSGAGLGLEQSLSVLTALRETMNAGEAATGARNVVSMLQTSGANATAVDALGRIGLSSKQVDIEGEGLTAALDTLRDATARLGEADRAEVLTKIFGRENTAAASILMNATGKFDQYAGMQRGAAVGFQADVATARTGAFADATRAGVSAEMDSVAHEDFVREQELMRQARVNLRTRAAKQDRASGGIRGRFDAAVRGVGGAVEDTIVAPLTGERVLGAAHEKEMERLANRGPGAVQVSVDMPPELRQVLLENNRLLAQQLAAQQNGKHAGVVAGRRENQMEGAR